MREWQLKRIRFKRYLNLRGNLKIFFLGGPKFRNTMLCGTEETLR